MPKAPYSYFILGCTTYYTCGNNACQHKFTNFSRTGEDANPGPCPKCGISYCYHGRREHSVRKLPQMKIKFPETKPKPVEPEMPEVPVKLKNIRRIAVVGDKHFAEPDLATQYIDRYITKKLNLDVDNVMLLCCGDLGIGHSVHSYCHRRGIKLLIVYHRWVELEKVALPRAYKQMIDMAHDCLIFSDKDASKDTDYAETLAKEKGILRKHLGVVKLRKILKVLPPTVHYLPEVKHSTYLGERGRKKSTAARKPKKDNKDKIRELLKAAKLKKFSFHD
jgi:hypothetical protein